MDEKYVVQKDHELVRKAVNQFTYKQNQLMAILLGKYVHTRDRKCMDAVISIDVFRQIMDLSDGNNNYNRIKLAVEDFGRNGSVGIYDDSDPSHEKYIWRPYFSKIILDKNNVIFKWNPEMYPDLIEFKNQWTGYLANDYLKLSSVNSQNLYEQMKSYQNMPTRPQITFTIADLHRIMKTDNMKSYQNFNTLKNLCIRRAVDDINEKTDIYVEYDTVKDPNDKRFAIGLAFTILSKNEYFNYKGCWLSGDEINDIIYTYHAKSKIFELSKIKKENKQYYTLLRHGNKSDYDIILNFINNDANKKIKEEKLLDEKMKQLQSPQSKKINDKESNKPQPAYPSEPLKTTYAQVSEEDMNKYLSKEQREELYREELYKKIKEMDNNDHKDD